MAFVRADSLPALIGGREIGGKSPPGNSFGMFKGSALAFSPGPADAGGVMAGSSFAPGHGSPACETGWRSRGSAADSATEESTCCATG